MKIIALGLLGVITATSAQAAGETPRPRHVDSPECKRLIEDMPGYIQSEFDHYSPNGESAFLRHPLTKSGIIIICLGDPTVNFGASTWRPNHDWFTLATVAGHVASPSADPKKVARNIVRCVVRAAKSETTLYTVRGDGIGAECQVQKNEYGGDTEITIYKYVGPREEF